MTAPAKPTTDEMIEQVKNAWRLADMHFDPDHIIATLEAHKRITEAAGRPEPVAWILPGDDIVKDNGWIDAHCDRWGEFTKPLYGPDLLAYADRMESAYKMAHQQAMENGEKRLVAERQLAELQRKHDALVKDAERFRALQNMEPVKAQQFFWNYSSRKQRAAAIDAAMSA